MLRPTPWSHYSGPIAETLFSVSRAWHERKDTATGRGNHEKAGSPMPTGSVSSQGDTSLTLLLLAVSHFALWLPLQSDGFIPPIHFIIWRVKALACSASMLLMRHFLYWDYNQCPHHQFWQHYLFIKQKFLLWSSVSIIRGIPFFRRHVKEILPNYIRRYLAKLNTLPDTFLLSVGQWLLWLTCWLMMPVWTVPTHPLLSFQGYQL